MGTFSSKYNSGNSVRFDVDTKDFTFVKLADLKIKKGKELAQYKIDGMYIVRGKMGEQPVFINAQDKQLINMPSHMTDRCKDILKDEEAVEAIKDGKVGFTIYEYESKNPKSLGKVCRGVNFVDFD